MSGFQCLQEYSTRPVIEHHRRKLLPSPSFSKRAEKVSWRSASRCRAVCVSVCRAATACRISLGGEGNALYPVLSSSRLFLFRSFVPVSQVLCFQFKKQIVSFISFVFLLFSGDGIRIKGVAACMVTELRDRRCWLRKVWRHRYNHGYITFTATNASDNTISWTVFCTRLNYHKGSLREVTLLARHVHSILSTYQI